MGRGDDWLRIRVFPLADGSRISLLSAPGSFVSPVYDRVLEHEREMWRPYVILCVLGMTLGGHCIDHQLRLVYGDLDYASIYECAVAANDWFLRLEQRPGWHALVVGSSCLPPERMNMRAY
jgi:hypothetical protein